MMCCSPSAAKTCRQSRLLHSRRGRVVAPSDACRLRSNAVVQRSDHPQPHARHAHPSGSPSPLHWCGNSHGPHEDPQRHAQIYTDAGHAHVHNTRNLGPRHDVAPRRRGHFGQGALAASRRVEARSRHRRDWCPSHDAVGGFFCDFEAVNAPRRSSTATTRMQRGFLRRSRR